MTRCPLYPLIPNYIINTRGKWAITIYPSSFSCHNFTSSAEKVPDMRYNWTKLRSCLVDKIEHVPGQCPLM